MESDSKRAILAVILSAIVLFGWQYFFPTPQVATSQPTKEVKAEDPTDSATAKTPSQNTNEPTTSETPDNQDVESFTVSDGKRSYTLNSHLEVVRANAINSKEVYPDLYEEVENEVVFSINDKDIKPFFNFRQISDTEFSLSSNDHGVSGTVKLDEKGFLNFK